MEAYRVKNPEADIQLIRRSAGELAAPETGGIYFCLGPGASEAPWKVEVGRQILVAAINPNNPWKELILQKGISRERLLSALTGQETITWSMLVDGAGNEPVRIFMAGSEPVRSAWTRLTGTGAISRQVAFIGGAAAGDVLSSALNSLLFCSLTDIAGTQASGFVPGALPVPIDRNGDGNLDYMEQIYQNPASIIRGAWIGKYPREQVTGIYAAASARPSGTEEIAFLKWILTGGQAMVAENGFSSLDYGESASKAAAVGEALMAREVAGDRVSAAGWVQILAGAGLAAGLLILGAFGFRRRRKIRPPAPIIAGITGIDPKTLVLPRGLYYDKSHTWTFMEKDGSVRIGIDDFIQRLAGPVTRVELLHAGGKVKRGQPLVAIIQDGKRLQLKAPVSGTIRECNTHLAGRADLLNTSPYHEGWLYRIEPSGWLSELPLMSMAEKYSTWLTGETARVRDFFAGYLAARHPGLTPAVLYDGGLLRHHLLAECGPEVWDDFQEKILDTAQ